jgi:hypothetical protein
MVIADVTLLANQLVGTVTTKILSLDGDIHNIYIHYLLHTIIKRLCVFLNCNAYFKPRNFNI